MRFLWVGIVFFRVALSWSQDLESPIVKSEPQKQSRQRFQIETTQMVSGLIVLSNSQRDSLVPFENFTCFQNPFGNCYGIDRLSHTILERVLFEHDNSTRERDSNETILKKLLDAHYKKSEVTILGFRDSKEFFETFNPGSEHYHRDTHDFDPLLSAIVLIQNGQSEAHNARSLKINAFMDKFCGIQTATSLESLSIKSLLKNGVPVKIMIHRGEDLHAVTIYGYYENQDHRLIFLVHDSNLPQKFQDLYLTPTGWIYPPWSQWVEVNVNIMNQKEENEALKMKQKFKPVKLSQPIKQACQNWIEI